MKQFEAYKKLANAVIEQAIIDILKPSRCSRYDVFSAKEFLKNNCFEFGDFLDLTQSDIQKRIENKKNEYNAKNYIYKERHTKPVICVETKRVYKTIREAEITEGRTTIGRCCLGLIETVAGQHWMFLDEYQKEFEN